MERCNPGWVGSLHWKSEQKAWEQPKSDRLLVQLLWNGSGQPVVLQFFAQGGSADAQQGSGF